MRIDPAPSVAVAAAHRPAATAAALPPLEPPGLRSVFHGLRVIPNAGPSVSPMIASSGVFVLPITTAPAARRRRTSSSSSVAGVVNASVPYCVTSPVTSWTSFTAIGTPSSGRSSPAPLRASACWASTSARSDMTLRNAFSSGSSRSIRSRYSSTSSREDTSPARMSSAWRATPAKASSSSSMRRAIYSGSPLAGPDRRPGPFGAGPRWSPGPLPDRHACDGRLRQPRRIVRGAGGRTAHPALVREQAPAAARDAHLQLRPAACRDRAARAAELHRRAGARARALAPRAQLADARAAPRCPGGAAELHDNEAALQGEGGGDQLHAGESTGGRATTVRAARPAGAAGDVGAATTGGRGRLAATRRSGNELVRADVGRADAARAAVDVEHAVARIIGAGVDRHRPGLLAVVARRRVDEQRRGPLVAAGIDEDRAEIAGAVVVRVVRMRDRHLRVSSERAADVEADAGWRALRDRVDHTHGHVGRGVDGGRLDRGALAGDGGHISHDARVRGLERVGADGAAVATAGDDQAVADVAALDRHRTLTRERPPDDDLVDGGSLCGNRRSGPARLVDDLDVAQRRAAKPHVADLDQEARARLAGNAVDRHPGG